MDHVGHSSWRTLMCPCLTSSSKTFWWMILFAHPLSWRALTCVLASANVWLGELNVNLHALGLDLHCSLSNSAFLFLVELPFNCSQFSVFFKYYLSIALSCLYIIYLNFILRLWSARRGLCTYMFSGKGVPDSITFVPFVNWHICACGIIVIVGTVTSRLASFQFLGWVRGWSRLIWTPWGIAPTSVVCIVPMGWLVRDWSSLLILLVQFSQFLLFFSYLFIQHLLSTRGCLSG